MTSTTQGEAGSIDPAHTLLVEFVERYAAGPAALFEPRIRKVTASNELFDAESEQRVLEHCLSHSTSAQLASIDSEWSFTRLDGPDAPTICISHSRSRQRSSLDLLQKSPAGSGDNATVAVATSPAEAFMTLGPRFSSSVKRRQSIEASLATSKTEESTVNGDSELYSSTATSEGSSGATTADSQMLAQIRPIDDNEENLPTLPRSMQRQGPRAEFWLTKWETLEVPGVTARELQDLIGHYRRIDWSQTTLGPMNEWPDCLMLHLSLAMGCPHPTIAAYGPDLTLLYNVAYCRNIAGKHPRIMGLPYLVGWAEVTEYLSPPFAATLAGKAQVAYNDKLYLHRDDYLEECYFSWSMSPIWNDEGKMAGIWVPNFDTTKSVVTERRIRLLREASQAFTLNSHPASLYRRVCQSVSKEPDDIPLLVFYDCSAADDERDTHGSAHDPSTKHVSSSSSGDAAPQHGQAASAIVARTEASLELLPDTAGDEEFANTIAAEEGARDKSDSTFIRAAISGTPSDSAIFPPEIASLDPATGKESAISHPAFLKVFREVLQSHEQRVMYKQDIAPFAEALGRVPGINDLISTLVLIPILTMDNSLRGVGILGLNPRKAFDDDYQMFVDLFRSQVSHGITSIRLVNEEIRRSRFFAALVKRKNEELHQLLDARTEELRSSELKFLKMAEMSPAGIYTANLNGEITFVNEAWWRVSGHPRDAHPNTWPDSVEDEDRQQAMDAFELIREGHMVPVEFRWKKHSGEPYNRWVYIVSSPECDEDGKMVAVTGVFTDVTSKKLAEEKEKARAEEAIELRRQQERFIDMTSHEMRNPLSAICLAADASAERLESLTTAKDLNTTKASLVAELADTLGDLKIISHCTIHMSRLIDDTLTLSKLDNHFLVITPVPCRPVEFIKETMSVFRGETQSKDIALKLEFSPSFKTFDIDYVLTDPSRINQLFINLLTNAIKFTAQSTRRRITVSIDVSYKRPVLSVPSTDAVTPASDQPMVAQQQGGETLYLICSIADTGRGLTSQEISGLFQRFKQANAKTHVQYGGSGLGLFICRRIVELLGGEIGVKSERGSGSEFTFYVPVQRCELALHKDHTPSPSIALTAEMAAAAALSDGRRRAASISANVVVKSGNIEQPPSTVPAPPLSVLIVEDNVVNQKLLDKNLTRAGCRTMCANHGQEAIDIIEQSSWAVPGGKDIDCVLMDIEMPVLDGLSAMKIIREMQQEGKLNGHVPVLAVSANARQEQIDAMIEAGFDATVSKPFKIPIILQRMRSVVAEWKPSS